MRLRAVLTRIDDQTSAPGADADAQRLALLGEPADLATYRSFLVRLYGFEAPVEVALQMTSNLNDVIDLRARLHTRLLRSDLAALGIVDVTAIERCTLIPRFPDVLEALGWMYVIERGRMLHSILHRHFQQKLPVLAASAATYLASERSAARRMRELGATFESVVRSDLDVDHVLHATQVAFRAQAQWYAYEQPAQSHVA
ncbi:MAG: hypothetical protein JO257_06190 [Deltaproteobacteria bacterium]|nr:hypothetical protein [Deltaproteobacteria bacterium]